MRRAMTMISDGFYIVVYIGIEMLSALPLVNTTGYHMPEMRNNTGADEQLPFGIIIDTPGIAEAMRHHFKPVFYRVIAPYAAIYIHPVAFQYVFRKSFAGFIYASLTFWFAYFGRSGKSLQPIQPS